MCINHNPVKDLDRFYSKVNIVHICRKLLKLSRNGQVNRIFMNLKKKLNPGVVLTLYFGYIYVYELIIKQVYWYIS